MLGTKAQSPQQIEEQIDGELDEAFHAAKSEKAKTSTVIVFLVLASMIFSYLIAYCLINALVAAEIMARWPINRDPRPKIFGAALIVSLSALGALAAFARSISRRQLNRIDEMQEG